jgi:hypothetical protein
MLNETVCVESLVFLKRRKLTLDFERMNKPAVKGINVKIGR